jgi:DNA-binding NarL/FixJ family response regulator
MTRKQSAVFELLLTGKSSKEIASGLGISASTVKKLAAKVYAAHGVQDRIQLMAKFIRRDTNEKQERVHIRDARQREAESAAS